MYRIASIPGDGIGPEVVSAAIQVVNKLAAKLGFQIEFTHIPWGTTYYKEHGQFMSDDALEVLRKFDASLFGAVGDPDVPDHVSLWGLLLQIRSPLQLFANVRPVRTFPGTKSPLNTAKNGIDWVLVRENSEGEYCGQGGRSHIGQPWEAATEVAVFTRVAIERIIRFAFETAQSRPKKKLTVVTKSNAMRHGMVLWDEVAEEVARDFPDVNWDKMLVDAMTIRMVAQPDSLDTIVGTNLHMDILSDLAAGLAGSIGIAPSSNLDPTRKNPSMFEPVHGSAFDITGKGVANPVATFWSAAEMLNWLGEKEAADKLMGCVERVCEAGVLTADLGGKAKTQDVVDAKEIGSLTAHSPQESQFVGSSSGVFFINTVRRAFGNSSTEFPQPEETLVGSEDTLHRDPHEETPVSQWEYDPSIACVLGQAPPQQLARDLMMVYFKVWHPLFPFLHGPTFLHAMESLYSEQAQIEIGPQSQHQQPQRNKHNSSWTTIFQCIFHLASLTSPDLQLPPECRIQPPISATRHDLLSLQALLASQLYLVATMSLRTASTVGGCMLRSMLHAGLHRCPFRYRELSASSQHRHLRKRIFWSAYALDRYLSQALGLPLGIQDSDVDVCPPGRPEVHKPLQHLPAPGAKTSQLAQPQSESEAEQARKETPFASYVQSGKLTGEALELFHKSIYVRSISQTSVLVLTTSVHKWWNSLDLQPSLPPQPSSQSQVLLNSEERPFNYTPFFTILYHHLLLLLNRPSLSLPNTTPEFASALQSCISAARHILLALNAQRDLNQALFWPGFLSAAWMAGLVLAFAVQLGQYVLSKGVVEINTCLDILRSMSTQWEPAKHCHRALTLLLRAVTRGDATAAPANLNAKILLQLLALALRTPSTTQKGKKRKLDSTIAAAEQERLEDRDVGVDTTAESNAFPEYSVPGSTNAMAGQQAEAEWETPLDLDMNMVDLLQEGNFDSLMDLFRQQYPTF
ncbi:hypothetical protein BDW69DRAFT_196431 [Aspergillus filifer]